MKINKTLQKTIFFLAIAASFGFGFALKTVLENPDQPTAEKGRVTGIGGIFFKCKDTKKLKEWYRTNLGLNTDKYGAVFEWYQGADSSKKGFTQWSPFNEKTKYFEPSSKDFMINYRVINMEDLVATLKENGATIVDSIQQYEYGKFVHVLDIEGNNLELWEPNDLEYEKLGQQLGSKTTK